MDLNAFRNWALSQGSVGKYNDGQFVGECVSLINQYCYRTLGIPAGAWGNAKDWATNAGALAYFNKVGDIQTGDILVYGMGQYGHIEIALGGGVSLGQNRHYDRKVRQEATLGGQIAILRSKTGGEMAITNADNEYGRWRDLGWRIRGRELSRQEFINSAVGQTWLRAVEILSDNSEAATAQGWQELGKLAQKDNWQGQIYGLIDQVANLNKRPTEEQLAELNKAIESLRKSAEVAENKAITAEKKAAEAIAEKTKLSDQATKDTEIGNSFLRWIGGLFNNNKEK